MTNPTAALSRVSSATLTTQLLKLHGLRNVAVRDVHAVDPACCRFVGPAYTVRFLPLREDLLPEQFMDHPNNRMTPLVEAIPAGAVLVLDANGRSDVGLLGGNIAARLAARGVAAVVTDGGMRDIAEIQALRLPMFIRAQAAPPSFTALMIADVQTPVAIGGVPVMPGDFVVGDGDGVVIVPAQFALEAAAAGEAMDAIEAYVHARLRRGEALPGLYPPSAQVRDEYQRWVAAGRPDLS